MKITYFPYIDQMVVDELSGEAVNQLRKNVADVVSDKFAEAYRGRSVGVNLFD